MAVFLFGDFELDTDRRALLRGGTPVPVQPQTFDLLVLLVERAGHVVPRGALLDALWPGVTVVPNALDQVVRRARIALGESSRAPQHLITAPRVGYRFGGAVTTGRVDPPDVDFVGRAEALSELVGAIQRPGVVTVTGPGGVGKTRLVQELLRDQGDGLFVRISGCRSGVDVRTAVAGALDVALTDRDPAGQLVRALAARGSGLLVLDNAEHLVDDVVGLVEEIVTGAPALSVVVTSRVPLGAGGERVLRLAPLSVIAARHLFARRAQQALPAFEMGDGQPLIDAIVERVDRLALAIEVVAAQVPVFGLRELHGLFTGGAALTDAMTTTVARSWELLAPWARSALEQLCVFREGGSLDALREVIDLSAFPDAPPVPAVVAHLFERSVVQIEIMPSGWRRYALFEVVRDFVAGRMEDPVAVRARHAAHYARLGHRGALASWHAAGGVARAERTAESLGELWLAARAEDPVHAVSATCALSAVILLRGPYAVGAELCAEVAARGDVSPGERARVLEWAGRFAALLGLPEAACEAQGDAALAFEAAGDFAGAARTQAWLADAHHHAGRPDSARHAVARARELAARGREPESLSLAYGLSCLVSLRAGALGEARSWGEKGLAIARDQGDRAREGGILSTMGIVHVRQGRIDVGRHHYEEALAAHREVGDRRAEAMTLQALGNLALESGDAGVAEPCYVEARSLFEALGDRNGQAAVLIALGVLAQEQGRSIEARDLYDRAVFVARDASYARMEAIALDNLGRLCLDEGRTVEAIVHLEAALARAQQAADVWLGAIVLGALASARVATGEPDAAALAVSRAEVALRELGDPYQLARFLCSKAELLLARGEAASARAVLDEAAALAIAREAGGSLLGTIEALRARAT